MPLKGASGLTLPITRQILVMLLALLVGIAVAAVLVWLNLPSPPGNPNVLSFLLQLALMSFIGPAIFVWAAGPHPLSLLSWAAAFLVPTMAAALIVFGYIRKRSFAALFAGSALWSGFGGYSAYLAATGSI